MTGSESEAGRRTGSTPIHLWIIGGLTLLWNLMGAFDYLATELRLDFYMSQFSDEQLNYFYSFPAWAVAGWALGVWGALAGSIGLLLRRRWAVWAFAISIVGMVATSLYTLVLSNGLETMGPGNLVFTAVIWAVAISLVLYARAMAVRGVLR